LLLRPALTLGLLLSDLGVTSSAIEVVTDTTGCGETKKERSSGVGHDGWN
jgi:hypothetical protein